MSFTSRISGSTVTQVDRPAQPELVVTEEDVKDASKLARLVAGIAKDVAALKRRFAPRRIDFEDRAVTSSGTVKYQFHHGFGGRVRWWVVDWQPSSLGDVPSFQRHSSSDANTLVLLSSTNGTATVRVEEAG